MFILKLMDVEGEAFRLAPPENLLLLHVWHNIVGVVGTIRGPILVVTYMASIWRSVGIVTLVRIVADLCNKQTEKKQ